ncbi:hypothetical protein K505DRAFT_328935 [Melanomma pulvis-pyrius CBS 109.77]|uniref:Uncharacterized protein n=1 Tax=Melanomma pulvis-pyrius CBS 109.77 TaxID=1314802 RepID=A0A6A6WWC8_9PLEO|nr:hypothetical protein K505DRAFT_328935 [Melanomma pulvis-pyrius CBS 109.77]
MCYFRHYLFLGCGHSTSSVKPVRTCANTRSKRGSETPLAEVSEIQRLGISPTGESAFSLALSVTETPLECAPGPSTPYADTQHPKDGTIEEAVEEGEGCKIRLGHPYQSFKIHRMCSLCTQDREQRLVAVTSGNEVKFEDWRWKVKYLSPVPEEARYTEWGAVGEAMGSWVKDWRMKGDGDVGKGTIQ